MFKESFVRLTQDAVGVEYLRQRRRLSVVHTTVLKGAKFILI